MSSELAKPKEEKKSTLRKIFPTRRRATSSTTENEATVGVSKMKITKEKTAEKEKKEPKKPKGKEDEEEPLPFETTTFKVGEFTFCAQKVVGSGSFGVVVRATILETNEIVAIKKVLQDKRYKNRELQIIQMLDHPNIVPLKTSFFTSGEKNDEVFLNLVLEFIPDTVYRILRQYTKMKQQFPIFYTKLYIYQLLRALHYIHSKSICHRDIKPQNLLLDPVGGILKLCDFGSAKILVEGETNVAYICSRYYRAPELIFGSTNYTPAIDLWSTGCVLAELLLGQPLFPGESSVDQLVEIIKVLGTPTKEEIRLMNSSYSQVKPFPQIKGHPWPKIFRSVRCPPEAIDLTSKLLQYIPSKRAKPIEALIHPFFDELREPNVIMPNGRELPPLFNFSKEELKDVPPHIIQKLIPNFSENTTTPMENN